MCFCERCIADKTQPQWIETLAARPRQPRLAPDPRPAPGRPLRRTAASASAPARWASRSACSTARWRRWSRSASATAPRDDPPSPAPDRHLPPGRRPGVHPVSAEHVHRASRPARRSIGDLVAAGRSRGRRRPGAGRRRRHGVDVPVRLRALDESTLDSATLPRRSLKEFFLPPTEPLFSLAADARRDVELDAVADRTSRRTVVLGARPCDAAALAILDQVMDWDYRDELWFGRREATTIVALACPACDESCFCTAVGLAPDATAGADLLLTPVDGGYLVEVAHPKGEALVAAHAARFADGAERPPRREQSAQAARERVRANLAVDADGDPRLARQTTSTTRCWTRRGAALPRLRRLRLRLPDLPLLRHRRRARRRRPRRAAAQLGHLPDRRSSPLHASGPQPARGPERPLPPARACTSSPSTPSRFGEMLCTGCGRCARVCPAGMDLPEILRGDRPARGRRQRRGRRSDEPLPAAPDARSRRSSTRRPTRARFRLAFQDPDGRRELRLQGRAVRRVLGLRRGRVHVLHRLARRRARATSSAASRRSAR